MVVRRAVPANACVMILAATLSLAACGRGAANDAGDAKSAAMAGDSKSAGAGASGSAGSGVLATQSAKRDPCSWISPADAARVLGDSLAHAPARVLSAENSMASDDGAACRYVLRGGGAGERGVSIEVMPDEPGTLRAAFAGMGNVEKQFRSDSASGDSLVAGRWDFVSVIPGGLVAATRGRIAIQLVSSLGMTDRAMKLAGAIVDGIPDLPFARDSADLVARATPPDPCALITRQEAESLMGPLKSAPFRSHKSTALAYGAGTSCTYFTGGHRALVVTPTRRNGAALFPMLAGVSGMVAGKLGGAAPPDTLDGPWDQVATGTNGSLNMLKDDKILSMQFQSSGASLVTAVKLARLAVPRL